MKQLMRNKFTGCIEELNSTMDVRIWEPISDPLDEIMEIMEINHLNIQAFHKRDEFRKAWYYKFFPWDTPKQDASFKYLEV